VQSQRRALQSDSTVGELQTFDYRVDGAILGEQIFAALERQRDLPGVMVDLMGSTVLMSRGTFFMQISKGFGREVFLRRSMRFLFQTVGRPFLKLSSDTPIDRAAAIALERPVGETYVLLTAQSQLLAIANIKVAQKVDALESANKALREAQAALVQSEKLASLGQLAAGVAHEINNPVAFVSANLSVLRREMDDLCALLNLYQTRLAAADPGAAAEMKQADEQYELDYILANRTRQFQSSTEGLRRVAEIVRSLSDFARLNHADRKEFDINAAVANTIDMLVYEKKKRGVEIVASLGKSTMIEGFPGKINQVFLNVIVNALQACQKGGVVEVVSYADDDHICVEVRDNGCGIPPEHRERIFDPFFTTKPIGQGTGLGLSISFGIIRDHGGTIEVDSTVGVGTTFRIRLPVVQRKRIERAASAMREVVACG
jgi:signal transduction histidine kinase